MSTRGSSARLIPFDDTMYAIGIDPDTKDCAIAAWDDDGPVAAQVIHVIRRKRALQSQVVMSNLMADTNPNDSMFGLDVKTIAIEGQQIDRRTKRPADIITLAHVTGAAAAWCAEWWGMADIIIPTPSEWKGGVAKHAHQGRMYKALGWGSTVVGTGTNRYARPTNVPDRFSHITPGQWKHVGDALLLARWAYNYTS